MLSMFRLRATLVKSFDCNATNFRRKQLCVDHLTGSSQWPVATRFALQPGKVFLHRHLFPARFKPDNKRFVSRGQIGRGNWMQGTRKVHDTRTVFQWAFMQIHHNHSVSRRGRQRLSVSGMYSNGSRHGVSAIYTQIYVQQDFQRSHLDGSFIVCPRRWFRRWRLWFW